MLLFSVATLVIIANKILIGNADDSFLSADILAHFLRGLDQIHHILVGFLCLFKILCSQLAGLLN